MDTTNVDAVRKEVRDHYGQLSREGAGCCGGGACCAASPDASRSLGYSAEQLAEAPDGSNLGLGCGNPQAMAKLVPGERVLDLGSGGGFDCFLAARQVGPTGYVIGVDMTPDMIERARTNARKVAHRNVEFRLGEIEHLPVADAEVDVIISNCVVNLSPEKGAVFREAFRVLRPGGRLAISDVVALAPLTEREKADVTLYTGCVAGAAPIDELKAMLADAGFERIEVDIPALGRATVAEWFQGNPTAAKVASASIEARRPGGTDERGRG
jgi:SAM-dependent methyltransferase